jgi:regulator of sirC expression with transglutaminase-like and TPR domain
MPRFSSLPISWVFALLAAIGAIADDTRPKSKAAAITDATPSRSVEGVAEAARKSVVVITFEGRDGKRQGLGTGFVVSADGLVATNLHVIGEGRPIAVQFADGSRRDVVSIHASDRSLDLALLRINSTDLTPLALADSDRLKEGQAVVAVGNPLGLTHSVVSGVVSAKRELEGRPMIQIAMPIEPGNSGGPLLDLDGRVHGILTLKSVLTPNLGFAVPINSLKPLLKKPNPIPVSRWLTIGSLAPAEWTVVFDARWKRRAGKIVAEGLGSTFAGRSLCLSQRAVPSNPFEIAVTVRLDKEAGAAGLVFHADGGDKHYGFYPSAGQLRLTRFDGPDVFSWKILKQVPSSAYRPGDWNTLKVRIEKDKFRCFVNGQLVTESSDAVYSAGKVGLAKFRDTRAEFKNFILANEVPAAEPSADLVSRVMKLADAVDSRESPTANKVDALMAEAPASVGILRDRARQLEQQAVRLKELASDIHHRRVQAELVKVFDAKEEKIDLFHAALLVARLDNEDVDVQLYQHEIARMVQEVQSSLAKNADEVARLAAINKYLFTERGFHGSRGDYYNRSNSYLNEVIDDREGLPITLSILYMEVAQRLGLNVVGIGLPGHFVVRYLPAKGDGRLLDPYDACQEVSLAEARKRVEAATGRPFQDEYLIPITKKAIVVRILHNLMGIARAESDARGMLRYLDTILSIRPDSGQERLMRAAVRFQSGDRPGASADIRWLIDRKPSDVPFEKVEELERLLNGSER